MNTQYFPDSAVDGGFTSRDATLVILDGKSFSVIELGSRTEWTIGRLDPSSQTRDIQLVSPIASRLQGEFRFWRGHWSYTDAPTATNKTLHNGVMLFDGAKPRETVLSNGDILRIDTPDHPHPDGVWILFSTVSILGKWKSISLTNRKSLTIGRDSSCDIQQPLPYVSARHAAIQNRNGQYFLIDCQSRDGVWLNGRKISGATPLKEKDWFSICDCHFIFVNKSLWYNSRIAGDRRAATGKILLSANIKSKHVTDSGSPTGRKELLRDVRLSVREGSLVALLGVSGAGKSTLLNCLNGFDSSGVDGYVKFRGENLYDDFDRLKRLIGSVPQENTFRDMQTVRTELLYDAILRLPDDSSPREINDRVESAMRDLGLSALGGNVIRSLSGGEKKRVSIGVELVADRALLCLDEPDAGLDPLTKRELFRTLKKLAHERGASVIVIIHDVAEIALFDQVIMLLKADGTGRMAYSGTPEETLRYFQRKSETDPLCRIRVTNMADAYELVTNNPQHYIWRDTSSSDSFSVVSKKKPEREKSLSLFKEFGMSVRQFAGALLSDKMNLLISLLFPVIAAAITVFVAGKNVYVHYEGTKSACFLLVSAAIWVGLFNSIQIIVRERAVIKLEYIAGRRLGCYVLSKGVVQMLLCLLESAILTLAFPCIAQRFDVPIPDKGVLLPSVLPEYYISLFLLMYAADTMGIFISCLVKKVEIANILSPYILILQLVFSGVLFPLEGIFDKISYGMLSKWGMEALGAASDANKWPLRLQLDFSAIPDREAESMFLRTAEHLTQTWLILFLFSIVFLILGSLVLRLVVKDSR